MVSRNLQVFGAYELQRLESQAEQLCWRREPSEAGSKHSTLGTLAELGSAWAVPHPVALNVVRHDGEGA